MKVVWNGRCGAGVRSLWSEHKKPLVPGREQSSGLIREVVLSLSLDPFNSSS